LGLLVTLLASVSAQQKKPEAEPPPEQFYKKPETIDEFWRYMNHEIAVGRPKIAAAYLKGFLDKKPSDEDLVRLHDREGSSAFMRLLTIPEMKADAAGLVERVDQIVQDHLRDRKRLDALIAKLQVPPAEPEDRSYALAQLQRSGAAAMPALIDALLRTGEDREAHLAVLSVLPLLKADISLPLAASLDINKPVLRAELLDVIRQRAEVKVEPFLWYYSAAPRQPEAIRTRARDTLAAFVGVKPDQLPPAATALTKIAESYYQHQVRFINPAGVVIWLWDGKALVTQTVPATEAEKYYGLRFAGQAIELDPRYTAAQVLYLSLALDKGFERGGVVLPPSKVAPEVTQLVDSANPELLVLVLAKALAERHLGVILAATRTLGDLGDGAAAKPRGRGMPPVLVKALYYPDRRVQLAAAEALLKMPASVPPPAPARTVEILRRALAGELAPTVLIGDFIEDRGNAFGRAVKQAGFEPIAVRTGQQVLRRLGEASDIDVIVLDADIPDPLLPYLLAQLRADANSGLLPIFITAMGDRAFTVGKLAERYRNVWVIPPTQDAAALKREFKARLTETAGGPLSEAERKDQAARAVEWLARLARQEVAGYDVRPAEKAILGALQTPELTSLALDAAARLPSRTAQIELAGVVLGNHPVELRSKAAVLLSRHIQQHGLVLSKDQVQALVKLFDSLTDLKLKTNLALVIASLHLDPTQTGERLLRYKPALESSGAGPKAPPKEEKDTADEKKG
jgi:hypothetical protein